MYVNEGAVKEAIQLTEDFMQSPFFYGEVWDADTILADIIDDSPNYTDEIGLGLNLLKNWVEADESGRHCIEDTFYLLMNVEFFEYVDRCIDNTTKV